MIKIKIAEFLKTRGCTSAYQLQTKLVISPTVAARLWKGDFDKIGINTINKICYLFSCQPNDLFEYVYKRGEHPLHDQYIPKKNRVTQSNNTQSDKSKKTKAKKAEKDEAEKEGLHSFLMERKDTQSDNTQSSKSKKKK